MTVCYSEAEVPRAVEFALSYSARGKVVAEKFITGQEVVIKYFVCDGEIYMTSMADLHTAYKPDGSRAYIGLQVFPSKYYDLFMQTADAKVREMIRGMGIINGPLSFDGFVQDGEFYFFDQSFRMGGAQDWRIVAAITGVNISDLLTHFALYGEMGHDDNIRNLDGGFVDKSACMLYFLVREGTIGKISGLPEATSRQSVIGYHLSHIEGDCVTNTGTSDHVVMRLLLVCDNDEELHREMEAIRSLISITDEQGVDMLLPYCDL
jgi:biotin carboxylase